MTSHPLTLITGASRGMGQAMAHQLLAQGHELLTISRHADPSLESAARTAGVPLTSWTADLAEPGPVAERLAHWLADRSGPRPTEVNLINNAGVIPSIAPIGQVPAADIARALRVGLEAAMVLSGVFLQATEAWNCPRRVLNISSGLGRKAMASQAAYCAAKAGMDHYTRCVALEEALRPNGARVCSLAPGVIDTDMQVQLRGADPGRFPDQGNFAALKAQGLLLSPEAAAARVLAWLARPDFGDKPVADVRDA
jgi:NAD(P)-dependent dehydrogenase (short-subunit alcohol dehydrogenase family)